MRIRISNVTYKDFYLLFQFALSAAEELLYIKRDDAVVVLSLHKEEEMNKICQQNLYKTKSINQMTCEVV